LDIWLVILVHSHITQSAADLDHSIIEKGRESLVVVKPLDSLLNEVEAKTTFILHTFQEVWHECVMLGVGLSAAQH
jgi:hypothetical protein